MRNIKEFTAIVSRFSSFIILTAENFRTKFNFTVKHGKGSNIAYLKPHSASHKYTAEIYIDDNAMNISVVEGLLKSTQIQVDKATGGLEALEKCAETFYDLILMDHMMPNIDGIETLHRLQEAEGPNQDTPVIVLTANAVSGAKEMYQEEGFIDYMSKPIQGKHLEEKILEYLPENRYVLIEYDKVEQDIFSKLWNAIANEIQAEYKFKQLDIPYLAFNFPIDSCLDCGYQGEFKDREWMQKLAPKGVFDVSYDIIIE